MNITTGTKFGRYEIRSLIGVGGMGELYRATDPKTGVMSPSRYVRPLFVRFFYR